MSNVIAWPLEVVDQVVCDFFVRGRPEPAGSKKAVPLRGQKGARSIVVDANKNAAPWKKQVADVARYEYTGEPLDEPLCMDLVFTVKRPEGHWLKDGRLSAEGQRRSRPTSPPDALKLARGVEDALTGVVYRDDSLIVYGSQLKRYQASREEPTGVRIRVRRAG